MNKSTRYFGIAALSLSLVMLSLGSIAQSHAQVVTSSMSIEIACGIIVANGDIAFTNTIALNDNLDSDIDPIAGGQPTLQNTGTAQTAVLANAGVPSAVGPGGGGYASADGITHINPVSISYDIGEGPIALQDSGTDIEIGTINTVSTDDLQLLVTVNGVNLPTSDPNWTATTTLTASCQVG